MSIKTQFLLLSLLSGLIHMPTSYAESSSQAQNSNQTIVLDVQNMTCAMCKFTIKKALTAVEGTKKVSVNYEDKIATVTFNPQKTNTKALIEAVTNAGYPATVQPR
jgi:mercuric ion binding protein